MFRSLSELIFNTSEIETNLFGMADDVYNTIEIFEEAARFEGRGCSLAHLPQVNW